MSQDLLQAHLDDAMDKFRLFCLNNDYDSHFDELDWYALSIGFFAALGLSRETVQELALQARYTHHYWC
jgi:hypothetical protein